jgi:hypothetical protein
MILELIHSYHYINVQENMYKLCLDTNTIINKADDSIIIGLLNIPKHNLLYSTKIYQIDTPFNNIKIVVEVNIPYLVNCIVIGEEIPYKNELIRLIKRNYYQTNYKAIHNTLIPICSKKIKQKINMNNISILENNLFKYEYIILDLKSETFFIDNNSIDIYKKYTNRAIIHNTLDIDIFKKIPYHTTLNLIIFKKNTDIEPLIRELSWESFSVYTLHNAKFIYCYENDICKDILNHNWNSITLFNIETIPNLLYNLSCKSKYIIIDNLNNDEINNYLCFLLDTNISLNSLLNKESIKSLFYIIKETNTKFKKKTFNLSISGSTFLNNLQIENKYQFISLPDSFLRYTIMNNNYLQLNYPDIFSNIDNLECSICLDKIEHNNLIVTTCKHTFCESCIVKYIYETNNNSNCPVCRNNLNRPELLKLQSSLKQIYSSKLNYIIDSTVNSPLLIISYFDRSIKALNTIFTYLLISCKIIKKNNTKIKNQQVIIIDIKDLNLIKNYKIFNKIYFLESDGFDFERYKNYINIRKRSHKQVKILNFN